MAAYERGSVTPKDETVLQMWFGVSSPESLTGPPSVAGLSCGVSWEAGRILSPPGTYWSGLGACWFPEKGGFSQLGRQPQGLPGLAQRNRNSVIMYEVSLKVLESFSFSLTPDKAVIC